MACSSKSSLSELQTTTAMPSPPSHSHQAAHAVLFTNELLCNIVARLPLPDVLAASRICRFWRGALKDDPNVKEALFLKPVQVSEVLISDFILEWNDSTLDDCSVIGKLNPLVEGIVGRVWAEVQHRHERHFMKLKYPDGLWREMFITQPPCKKVVVTIQEQGTWKEVIVQLERDTGIQLGELHDFIHSKISYDMPKSEAFVTVPNYVDQGDWW